jgi:hypothetical protein
MEQRMRICRKTSARLIRVTIAQNTPVCHVIQPRMDSPLYWIVASVGHYQGRPRSFQGGHVFLERR